MRSALLVILISLVTQILQAQEASLGEPNQATDASATAAFQLVARIVTVKARDGEGRIDRFTDAGNREFQIIYDAMGRIIAAKATARAHISDVRSIGYDSEGRLAGAQLGSRHLLLVSYREDGTQIIRDRFGGLILRQGALPGGYRVLQTSDPSGRLAAALDGLDNLLRAATSKR